MHTLSKERTKKQGFTLVELSIVIIIIGLLIAGIVAGDSLIKQAELNSVITDMQGYQTAYNNFQSRYNGVPGDLVNAESYWPSSGSTPCSVTAAQCNGDGDGLISYSTGTVDETLSAMRELVLAGMVSAGIPAIPDGNNGGVKVVGVTNPESRVVGAGYLIAGPAINFGGVTSPWNDGSTNALFIGKIDIFGNSLTAGAIKPMDAFMVDSKIDDGQANSGGAFTGNNTGKIRAIDGSDAIGWCIGGGGTYAPYDNQTCVVGFALN